MDVHKGKGTFREGEEKGNNRKKYQNLLAFGAVGRFSPLLLLLLLLLSYSLAVALSVMRLIRLDGPRVRLVRTNL